MWKSNVGDFKLKRVPCEHWFVRYGVFCEKLADAKNILNEEYDLKYATIEKNKDGQDYICSIQGKGIKGMFSNKFKIPTNCPFINDQMKCPEYSPSSYYIGMTLKEIRKMKGREV